MIAKSTDEKILIVQGVRRLLAQKRTMNAACDEIGVSDATYYNYVRSLEAEGVHLNGIDIEATESATGLGATLAQPPVLISGSPRLKEYSIKELISELKSRCVALVLGAREDEMTVHLTSKGNTDELWALQTALKENK